MDGAGEANGGTAGMPKAARDDSFKRPGAVPFLWEVRPGVARQIDYHTHDSPPQNHNYPLAPPPIPMPPETPELTPPPPLMRSTSTVPGHRRREKFSLSLSNSFSFSKLSRSNSPSVFAAGSHWRFWERGRAARHSNPSGSTSSCEAAPLSEAASPRRSTGSSETASSVSD